MRTLHSEVVPETKVLVHDLDTYRTKFNVKAVRFNRETGYELMFAV